MRPTCSAFLVTGSLVLFAACGSETPPEEPLARIDLRAATGRSDVAPVGVTIDATTGTRYLFDETDGLYRINADRSVTMVMPMADLPVSAFPVRPPYTDIVALGPDRFALTAIGDGFMLDLTAQTLELYFCYVPGDLPEVLDQRTDALTYDPVADRLYAQPRTFDAGGNLQWAQVASFERDTGVDLFWYDVPDDVVTTGMTIIPGRAGELLLGQDDQLSRFDITTSQLTELDDLSRFGIDSIQGLAIDPVARTLLVVDNQTDEVVEIELARLGL
jgi:hypothetical protein